MSYPGVPSNPNLVAPTIGASLLLQPLGSGSIEMVVPPFSFATNPNSFPPNFLNSCGAGGTFGLSGFYNNKGAYKASTTWAPTKLVQLSTFQMNSFGILDVTSNIVDGPGTGNLNGYNTRYAFVGRDGLYQGGVNTASNIIGWQRTPYPNLVFQPTNITLAPSSRFYNRNNSGGYSVAGAFSSFSVIDGLNVETCCFLVPYLQGHDGNTFYTTSKLFADPLQTSVATDAGGTVIYVSPLHISIDDIFYGITSDPYWASDNTYLKTRAVNPFNRTMLGQGAPLNTGQYIFAWNVLCDYNATSNTYFGASVIPLIFNNAADDALIQAYNTSSQTQLSVCQIPGGHWMFSFPGYIFIVTSDLSGYYKFAITFPSGVSPTYYNVGGRFGVDLNGNLWFLNLNLSNVYSGVYTSFVPINYKLPLLTVDIPAPLLSNFGLSCRQFNPCTLSFEG